MGLFDRFRKSPVKKLSKDDWDRFVTESIAEHKDSAPAQLTPDAPKQPFLERNLFGPMRRTVITLAIAAACIVFVPILILVVVGAMLPKEDPARRVQREYEAADREKTADVHRNTAPTKPAPSNPAKSGPTNRDPDNPPGPRKDYEWVNDKRVENSGGYWRRK